jgi:hypothetical protein
MKATFRNKETSFTQLPLSYPTLIRGCFSPAATASILTLAIPTAVCLLHDLRSKHDVELSIRQLSIPLHQRKSPMFLEVHLSLAALKTSICTMTKKSMRSSIIRDDTPVKKLPSASNRTRYPLVDASYGPAPWPPGPRPDSTRPR